MNRNGSHIRKREIHMPRAKRLNIDDITLILRLHERETPPHKIADALNISVHSVYRVIQFIEFYKEIEK